MIKIFEHITERFEYRAPEQAARITVQEFATLLGANPDSACPFNAESMADMWSRAMPDDHVLLAVGDVQRLAAPTFRDRFTCGPTEVCQRMDGQWIRFSVDGKYIERIPPEMADALRELA